MGESIWCNVQVKIPRTWVQEKDGPGENHESDMFPLGIELLGSALYDGEGPYVEERYPPDPDAVDDGTVIVCVNGIGNYGLGDSDVEAGLNWLEKHHIPFTASDDGKYDMGGEFRVFDGSTYVAMGSNTDAFGQVLTWSEWESIKAGNHWAKTVDDYFSPPTLESIPIDHLPAQPPTDEDLEEEDDVNE